MSSMADERKGERRVTERRRERKKWWRWSTIFGRRASDLLPNLNFYDFQGRSGNDRRVSDKGREAREESSVEEQPKNRVLGDSVKAGVSSQTASGGSDEPTPSPVDSHPSTGGAPDDRGQLQSYCDLPRGHAGPCNSVPLDPPDDSERVWVLREALEDLLTWAEEMRDDLQTLANVWAESGSGDKESTADNILSTYVGHDNATDSMNTARTILEATREPGEEKADD